MGDEKLAQKHVEAAFMKLEASLEGTGINCDSTSGCDTPTVLPSNTRLDGIKRSIERRSIEIAHFRFMLLACLSADEETLQKELEKTHDSMNRETREMLFEYGIPTKDRDREMAKFYRMQESMRGESDLEMEEER